MQDILFCAFYLLLFSAIILKSKWFTSAGFTNKHFLSVFYLKLLFGIVLYYIYTHIYKNRITSDIFKYYDDSKMIFSTLHTSVKDYFTLLTGIGDSDIHYQSIYHSMSSWDNGYDSNLYNNSHFIIRLNALFLLLSNGHYGVHVIFMCFIALVGLTYVYKAFVTFLPTKSKLLFASIFLFPSVILWSSGILKEPFVWLGLGLSIYYFFQAVHSGFKIKQLLFILIGFLLLFEAKAYVLICLIPCFISQYLFKKTRFFGTRPLLAYSSVLLLYLGSAFLPHLFLHKVNPLQMIADKQTDFNRIIKGGIHLEKIQYGKMKRGNEFAFISVADSVNIVPLTQHGDSLLHRNGIQYLASNPIVYKEWTTNAKIPYILKKGISYSKVIIGSNDTIPAVASDSTTYWVFSYIETANSRIQIEPIKPSIFSLLTHIPSALNVALILPYPWQLKSIMQIIYWLENVFILLLFFIALFFIKRPLENKDFIVFCLFYSFMMLVLIGLVTPILGGIERYKSVVIPFMFILLLLITDTEKIKNSLKVKK